MCLFAFGAYSVSDNLEMARGITSWMPSAQKVQARRQGLLHSPRNYANDASEDKLLEITFFCIV
jgi:hypothetical protein